MFQNYLKSALRNIKKQKWYSLITLASLTIGITCFILTTKKYIGLVMVANAVAWPVAYFAMNKWLQNFAYRIHLGIVAFLISGGTALFIAYLTVSYQAIKSARANPVESLRYE